MAAESGAADAHSVAARQAVVTLFIAATGLGLGSCQIGALYDDEINALLAIDGEREAIVYMTAIGRPAGR